MIPILPSIAVGSRMHRAHAEPEPALKRRRNRERRGLQDPHLRQVLPEHPLPSDPRQGPPQARRHPLLPHRQGSQARSRRSRSLFRPAQPTQRATHRFRRLQIALPEPPPQLLHLHPSPPPRRPRHRNPKFRFDSASLQGSRSVSGIRNPRG